MLTILLLLLSNVFMTFAWYGHLKVEHAPMWKLVLASWGIAFFEYCLMVPANRLGVQKYHMSPYTLKIIQEAITLVVFVGFAMLYLKVPFRTNHLVAFVLIFAAVAIGTLPEKAQG